MINEGLLPSLEDVHTVIRKWGKLNHSYVELENCYMQEIWLVVYSVYLVMVNIAVKGMYQEYFRKLRLELVNRFNTPSCFSDTVMIQSSLRYRAATYLNGRLITYKT